MSIQTYASPEGECNGRRPLFLLDASVVLVRRDESGPGQTAEQCRSVGSLPDSVPSQYIHMYVSESFDPYFNNFERNGSLDLSRSNAADQRPKRRTLNDRSFTWAFSGIASSDDHGWCPLKASY